MRRFVSVVLVVLALGCSAARADEASKHAKAEQLFTLMHLDRMMDQMMDNVIKQVDQMMQSMPGGDQATPEQKKIMADFQKRVLDLVNQKVGWKALEPDFVNLYAGTYTEEELDGMLTFYKSAIGQKMLDKTPELMAKSTEITQQKMREIQPEMNQMIQDFMKQMIAATPMPPPPPPSSPAKKQP
jgi:hypothetical protein